MQEIGFGHPVSLLPLFISLLLCFSISGMLVMVQNILSSRTFACDNSHKIANSHHLKMFCYFLWLFCKILIVDQHQESYNS